MPHIGSSLLISQPTTEPSGQRERAKHERRSRILSTAASLIEDGSLESATIRAIAAGAGVSPATIYNLVGSQNDIFDALHGQLIVEVVTRLEAITASPIEWILQSEAIAVECMSRRHALFGPLISQRPVANTHEYGPIRRGIVVAYRRQLDAAVESGQVDGDVDTEIIAELVHSSFIDNQVRWAVGEFDAATFERRSRAHAVAILRGAVTPTGRSELDSIRHADA